MPATAKRIALGGKNGGPSFLINNPTKWIRYKFDSTRVCMCGCVCVCLLELITCKSNSCF